VATSAFYVSFIEPGDDGDTRTVWSRHRIELWSVSENHNLLDLWIFGEVENGNYGDCEDDTQNVYTGLEHATCDTEEFEGNCSAFFGSIDGTSNADLRTDSGTVIWAKDTEHLTANIPGCADDGGGGGGGGGGFTPGCDPVVGCSPILLDIDSNGLSLTGAMDPVSFDINADGVQELLSWTRADSNDVFLFLDRNGNGIVDDGSELFGDSSPQPPSLAPNGFDALAVFDNASDGGDEDGWITARDAIFGSLELWNDRSHDGESQASEIGLLSETEVIGISLHYVESAKHDPHGNVERWRSLVEFSWGKRMAAVDVIFVAGDALP